MTRDVPWLDVHGVLLPELPQRHRNTRGCSTMQALALCCCSEATELRAKKESTQGALGDDSGEW